MTPSRPYLLRALHQWIVDNRLTPHILVDANAEGVAVPQQHVEDGKIVLNISPQAIQGLQLRNDSVAFGARFGGAPMQVQVPIGAVLAIYARENGKGMVFSEEDGGEPPPEPDKDASNKPGLRLVK